MRKKSREKTDWQSFLKSLSEIEVDFVIIGGSALTLYGIPRTTIDVDIETSAKEDNIRRLIHGLEKAGLKLDNEDFLPLVMKPELLYGQCLSFSIPNGPQLIDVFLEEPKIFTELLRSSQKIKFGDFNLQVADLSEIRRMKLEVGRPIDLADVALIDEFLEITGADEDNK
ncbi:MAG: hypothetical protein WAX69_03500 [Victivallales bacterium]